MSYLPKNIAEASTLLAVVFALASLLITIVMLIRRQSLDGTAFKLLGSLMVLAVAFAANNAFVYAAATFIVATLVTELEFLEKLAAIVWNRGEYFKYKLETARADEIAVKRLEEATAEGVCKPADPVPIDTIDYGYPTGGRLGAGDNADVAVGADDVPVDEAVSNTGTDEDDDDQRHNAEQWASKASVFEEAAMDALYSRASPFRNGHVKRQVKVSSKLEGVILDGVVETPGIHFVLEVKYRATIRSASQVVRGAIMYRSYLQERRIGDNIVPVMVVPSDWGFAASRFFAVLVFDVDSGSFTNEKEFWKQVDLIIDQTKETRSESLR